MEVATWSLEFVAMDSLIVRGIENRQPTLFDFRFDLEPSILVEEKQFAASIQEAHFQYGRENCGELLAAVERCAPLFGNHFVDICMPRGSNSPD